MAKTFVDTNILAYSVSSDDPRKEDISRKRLTMLEVAGEASLSTQVLQEFLNVMVRKQGFPFQRALGILQAFESYDLVVLDRQSIYRGIDIAEIHRLSFWDGLILAAAERADCTILLTEDLSDGQLIEGIRVENPF